MLGREAGIEGKPWPPRDRKSLKLRKLSLQLFIYHKRLMMDEVWPEK